jgi:glycosyltransferase involved in cell wall biosynthesis
MNLCLVSNAIGRFQGGHSGNFRALAAALCERGHRVTMLTALEADAESQHHDLSGIEVIGVRRTPGPSWYGFGRAVANWLEEHRSQFDVVHVNGSAAFLTNGKRSAIPLVTHLRGCNVTIARATRADEYFRWDRKSIRLLASARLAQSLDYMAAQRSSHVIANTAETQEALERSIPGLKGKSSILPNGVGPGMTVMPEEKLCVRKDLGLAEATVVGCYARMTLNKGWGYFVDIARELARLEPSLKLLFIGKGPLLSTVQMHAERELGRERVVFVSDVTSEARKRSLLAVCDLMIYPSSPGTTVLEAVSQEVPVLVARRTTDCAAGIDFNEFLNNGVGMQLVDAAARDVALAAHRVISTADSLGASRGSSLSRE